MLTSRSTQVSSHRVTTSVHAKLRSTLRRLESRCVAVCGAITTILDLPQHLLWLPDAEKPTVTLVGKDGEWILRQTGAPQMKLGGFDRQIAASPHSKYAITYGGNIVESIDIEKGEILATWRVPENNCAETVCFSKEGTVAVRSSRFVFYLTLPDLHCLSSVGFYEKRFGGYSGQDGYFLTAT